MASRVASAGPAPGTDARRAIAMLVDTHGGRLRALALRLCRNKDDAEDMVQEVFLRALRRWGTFRGESEPGTWLYAIAARACRERFRRKGGADRRVPAVSQLMPWGEGTVMAIATAPDDTGAGVERREAVERVQGEIVRLPEHLRLPLILKDILGLSVEDAASALGLATNTVKTRLHRARLALRKAMATHAASVPAPAPIYERQVCLDLLKAKLEAMDRAGTGGGGARGLPQAEVCSRCRAVFRELDMVQDACVRMGEGALPRALRARILRAIAERDAASGSSGSRRGRRPVRAR